MSCAATRNEPVHGDGSHSLPNWCLREVMDGRKHRERAAFSNQPMRSNGWRLLMNLLQELLDLGHAALEHKITIMGFSFCDLTADWREHNFLDTLKVACLP